MERRPRADAADVRVVGLPRALLYYRYRTLWASFFEGAGRTVVVSRPTDRELLERGDALSIDECCLASKIYLGHVASLAGSCDAVFVPCMANLGHFKEFCTKFQSLPDVVANTFPDLRVLSCLAHVTEERQTLFDAFSQLGCRLGLAPRDARRLAREAMAAQDAADRAAAEAQERALAAAAAQSPRPLTILLVAHPYLARDPYTGGTIRQLMEGMGATVLLACETDHARSYAASLKFSETLPWLVNRELVGALTLLHERVDGIVLMSAFPCGPDSMTDDAVMRCIPGKPILNLTIDAQSGTAGLETRVESFVDILRYQREGGYAR